MSSEKLLEWTDPDETRRVVIESTPSGNFRYYEEHFVTVDETAEGGGIYDYWRPMELSGLYPSVLDAQNDAAARLSWFGDLLAKLSGAGPNRD